MEPISWPGLLERLQAPLTQTVYLQAPAEVHLWKLVYDVIATLITAAATGVLAWFAYLEMQRASRAELRLRDDAAARTQAVQARVSAEAYTLRNILVGWLAKTPWIGDELSSNNGLDAMKGWAREFRTAHPDIDVRLVRTMALASEAPPVSSAAFTRAYASYYFADSAIEGALRSDSYQEIGNRVLVADHAIQSCCAALDQVVGDPLLTEFNAYIRDLKLSKAHRDKAEKLRGRLG
jgi:hypothetical protein